MSDRSVQMRMSQHISVCVKTIVVIGLLHCLCSVVLAASSVSSDQCRDKPGETVCCGNREYHWNPWDRVCCRLRYRSPDDKAYVLKRNCINGFAEDAFEECGRNNQFDIRFEDCCAGQAYDRLKQKCCSGSGGNTVVSLNTACCGGRGLRPGEMCCETVVGHIAINKSHPTHTDCCVPPDLHNIRAEKHKIQTFDNSTHVCDNGNIEEPFFGDNLDIAAPSLAQPSSSSSENEKEDLTSPKLASKKTKRKQKKEKKNKKMSERRCPAPEVISEDSQECLEGREKQEEGEDLKCCDQEPYRPSQKTCCQWTLHDKPSNTSLCCYDMAYDRGDKTNPCLGQCGRRSFNSDHQLCCKGKVFHGCYGDRYRCCGSSPIDDYNQDCCGGMPIDKDKWKCCAETMPYNPQLMHCNKDTASVTLNHRQLKQQNIPLKFCQMKLDTWGDRWRALIDPELVKVQGRVEPCKMRKKRSTLTIPIVQAVTMVGGHAVSSCLQDNGLKLKLVLAMPPSCKLTKRHLKKLKHFLSGSTLEIFIQPGKMQCRGSREAVIHLGENEVALVLQSHRIDRQLNSAYMSGLL